MVDEEFVEEPEDVDPGPICLRCGAEADPDSLAYCADCV